MALPTSEALKKYQAHLKQRQVQDALVRQQRYEQGWEQAKKAAAILKKKYGVRQVLLFGSLLSPENVHADSDLDLAVWGLPLISYCTAVGNLLVEVKGFDIDLVRLEDAQPSLKAYILTEGVEL